MGDINLVFQLSKSKMADIAYSFLALQAIYGVKKRNISSLVIVLSMQQYLALDQKTELNCVGLDPFYPGWIFQKLTLNKIR